MSVWTTKLRGPALGLTLGAALVAAVPAQAAERAKSSKPETVGVFSGLVIGAAAGGPIGAIVGAAGGAILGDRFHRKDVKNAELAASLAKSEVTLANSEVERMKLQGDLLASQAHGDALAEQLSRGRDFETAIGFRTGEATLSSDDVARLQKLGVLAGATGQMKVRIDGFADPRGSEAYNASLSQRRAEAVAEVLTAVGVAPERLIVEAHGESASQSATGDLDGYALERRVTVRIEAPAGDSAVARN